MNARSLVINVSKTKVVFYASIALFFVYLFSVSDNPAGPLLIMVIFGFCYLLYLDNAKRKKKFNILKPHIKRFISGYMDSSEKWPRKKMSIETAHIKAFNLLMERDYKIKVQWKDLNRLIDEVVLESRIDQFDKSFILSNPDLRTGFVLDDLISAYVNTFNSDLMFIDFFQKMAERYKIYANKDRIVSLINNRINEKTFERKVIEVQEAMTGSRILSSSSIQIEKIDAMDGLEFEHFLNKLFTAMGYQCIVTRASGDQGADLILERHGQKTAVQAKRYSQSVNNKAIQEVVAAKGHYGCESAMVVTSNFFNKSAIELARTNNVQLIDRYDLAELIKLNL